MVKKNTNTESAADRGKIIAADVAEPARLARALTGRDIINALAGSPLAEVTIERLSVKSKVRDVAL
jgi:putative NADH-flavin reductase